MCYFLYLSTDDDADLTAHNSPLLRFDRNLDQGDKAPLDLLQFDHKWYVGSKSSCSCTFRLFFSTDLGFHMPQDWCYEEPDKIEATGQFYDVIGQLVGRGKRVDCLSWWVDTPADKIVSMDVDLAVVTRQTFLFLENHRYVFCDSHRATQTGELNSQGEPDL